jgi:hypothetical protein
MRAARLVRSSSLLAGLALSACGGAVESSGNGQPAEAVAPKTRALPPGDCHASPAATSKVLFAPFVAQAASYPSPNRLTISGDHVYAALRTAETSPKQAGPVALYVGSTSPAADDFQLFTTIEQKQVNFTGGPSIGAHHVYWWQQLGSEWTIEPSRLAYRDADGATRDIAGTEVTYGAATVIDGDEVFALTCADDRPDNTACESPTSRFTLFSSRLDTGTQTWRKDLPAASGQLGAAIAVDDRWVYWTAPADPIDATKPARLLRVARAGGDVEELPAGLGAGESVARIVVDNGAIVLVVLTPQSTGGRPGPADMALVSVAADGTIRPRVGLHVTSAPPLIAIDQSSVYFTYDDGAKSPGTSRTLARACRDGSNVVTLVQGFAEGSATRKSVSDLAIDDHRVYFTSANQVLAIDK